MSEKNAKPRRLQIIAAVGATLLITASVLAYRQYLDTYHFAEVQPGVLYRDGNRTMREFKTAVRKGNIRTVVMLNDDGELERKPQFKEELKFCEENGIKVVRVPVPLGGRPTSEDIQKFLDAATAKENHPVLVHCAQGVRRTAMMVAAYQETVQKKDDETVKKEIIPWGRKSENLNDIRSFIEDYDPQSRTVKPATQPSQLDEID